MDKLHKYTDGVINATAVELTKSYEKASKELISKLTASLSKKTAKESKLIAEMNALKAAGKDTTKIAAEITALRKSTLITSASAQARIKTIAAELSKIDQQAASLIGSKMTDVFTQNFLGFDSLKVKGVDFTIFNKETVLNLAKKKQVLPLPSVDIPLSQRWNISAIESQLMQGVLQGESIPTIAKRLSNVAEMDRNSSIRTARTSMTSAQNSGRNERFNADKDDFAKAGYKLKKVWLSTSDSRTRPTHADLNGQVADDNGYFTTMYGDKLRYPGDPLADPGEVYNCRCTMTEDYEKI